MLRNHYTTVAPQNESVKRVDRKGWRDATATMQNLMRCMTLQMFESVKGYNINKTTITGI